MREYKFEFRRGAKKDICPACGQKTFKPYVWKGTYQIVDSGAGKCDRLDNCGYIQTPNISKSDYLNKVAPINEHKPKQFKPFSRIDAEQVVKSEILLGDFVEYFSARIKNFKHIARTYRLGYIETVKKVDDDFLGCKCSVFWQIDRFGIVRTGKVIEYKDGKKTGYVNFIHYLCRKDYPEFELKQCFFGLHLANDISKPIAIVESEKTAIIAACLHPDFIWLASGGADGLTLEKASELPDGCTLHIFPDTGRGFEKTRAKAKELAESRHFKQVYFHSEINNYNLPNNSDLLDLWMMDDNNLKL